MNTTYAEEWPQFYTATILNWQHLLKDDKCKDIIIESLQFLTTQKRITIYGFIIMSNHIHLLWQPMAVNTISSVQSSFGARLSGDKAGAFGIGKYFKLEHE